MPSTHDRPMPTLRPAWTHGRLLACEALVAEARAQALAARMHFAGAHAPGVVAGLALRVDGGSYVLGAGVAVDGWGNEIVVTQDAERPLDELARVHPARVDAFVAIRPLEHGERHVSALAELRLRPAPRDARAPSALRPAAVAPELAAGPAAACTRVELADEPWDVPLGTFVRTNAGWRVEPTPERDTLRATRLGPLRRGAGLALEQDGLVVHGAQREVLATIAPGGLRTRGGLRTAMMRMSDALHVTDPASAGDASDGAGTDASENGARRAALRVERDGARTTLHLDVGPRGRLLLESGGAVLTLVEALDPEGAP